MTFDGAELWLGLLFLAVGIGFGWGRRHGRKDGFLEGVRFAPLELRRASLERAHCVICGRGAREDGEEGAAALGDEHRRPQPPVRHESSATDDSANEGAENIALDNGDGPPL